MQTYNSSLTHIPSVPDSMAYTSEAIVADECARTLSPPGLLVPV